MLRLPFNHDHHDAPACDVQTYVVDPFQYIGADNADLYGAAVSAIAAPSRPKKFLQGHEHLIGVGLAALGHNRRPFVVTGFDAFEPIERAIHEVGRVLRVLGQFIRGEND